MWWDSARTSDLVVCGPAANVKTQQSGNAEAPSSEERPEDREWFLGLVRDVWLFLENSTARVQFSLSHSLFWPRHTVTPTLWVVGVWLGSFDWPPFRGGWSGLLSGLPAPGRWVGGLGCWTFMESLILAQDERWRRA